MKTIILILLALVCCIASAEVTNKKVLILWDSTETNSLDYTTSLAHQKFEVILNHFGIQADYLDNKTIPKDFFRTQNIKKYSSLISWINNDKSSNPIKTFNLFKAFNKLKTKIVILGDIPLNNHPNLKSVKDFFTSNYGFNYTDAMLENQLVLEINGEINKNLVEFERPLKNEILKARIINSTSKNTTRLLSLTDKIENTVSDIIFHNKNIFLAQSNYILYTNNYNNISQWRINPFYLTKWILDFKVELIPDTTTLYGKRILYSHIDGDAFISISDIDRKSYCGEIILNKIITPYKLPVSTSFVMAEIDEKILGTKRLTKIVKNFLKSPYIEVASHTYSHPLSWDKIPSRRDIETYSDIIEDYKGGPILAYKIPNYKELDYNKEITESLSFINNLSISKKRSNIVFWSGSCKPPAEALKIISENNILNINGGDSRFDKRFPSFSHLYPLYRKVGKYYQIYSTNSNENTYTNLWKGPFGGYSELIDTFKNTEEPFRIKPLNVYYHFYSGEKESSVTALEKIYNWVLTQNFIPIFTSDYIKVINSFINIQIKKISSSVYKIYNNNDLRTLKINKKININYQDSVGMIGESFEKGTTYISILPNVDSTLVLQSSLSKNYPFVISSDGLIDKFKYKNKKLEIQFKSYFKKELKLNNINLRIKKNNEIANITYGKSTILVEFKEKTINTILEFEK